MSQFMLDIFRCLIAKHGSEAYKYIKLVFIQKKKTMENSFSMNILSKHMMKVNRQQSKNEICEILQLGGILKHTLKFLVDVGDAKT